MDNKTGQCVQKGRKTWTTRVEIVDNKSGQNCGQKKVKTSKKISGRWTKWTTRVDTVDKKWKTKWKRANKSGISEKQLKSQQELTR